MRFANLCVVMVVVVAGAVTSGHAAIVFSDNFESYSAGQALDDGVGGWYSQDGVVSVQNGVVPGYGQSAVLKGYNHDNVLRVGFTAQTDTIYIGFTLRTSAFDGSDFIQFYVNDRTGSSANDSVSAGVRNQGGNPYFARVGTWGNTTNSSSASHDAGVTDRLVLKLSKHNGSSKFNRTDVFVDRTDELVADATRMGGGSSTSLSQFHVRMYSVESGQSIYLDDFVVATTFDEAAGFTNAGIPEPVTLTLALAGMWLVGRRPRNGRK